MTTSVALMEWAERQLGQPFAWGLTDCATLAIRGVELQTGRALGDGYVWASEAEARRVAEAELPSSVLAAHGMVEVDPGFQRCGDVILIPHADWPECCHLCLGRYSLTSTLDHGVIIVRTSALVADPAATVMGLR
jgi:hypothetical protein